MNEALWEPQALRARWDACVASTLTLVLAGHYSDPDAIRVNLTTLGDMLS